MEKFSPVILLYSLFIEQKLIFISLLSFLVYKILTDAFTVPAIDITLTSSPKLDPGLLEILSVFFLPFLIIV